MARTLKKLNLTPTELTELIRIANAVWQYIGSDVLLNYDETGEEPDNEECIESCFDADRPLLSSSSQTPQADNDFCKKIFDRNEFSDVCRAVANNLQLV